MPESASGAHRGSICVYASLLRVNGHGHTNYGSSIEAKICMAFEISAAFLLSDEIRADGLTSSILVT